MSYMSATSTNGSHLNQRCGGTNWWVITTATCAREERNCHNNFSIKWMKKTPNSQAYVCDSHGIITHESPNSHTSWLFVDLDIFGRRLC